MGTRGYVMVRFRGRYYIRYNHLDSYYEGLGAELIADIPTDPNEYQKWLDSMRLQYAAKENDLESEVYEIRDDVESKDLLYKDFVELPSEFPVLDGPLLGPMIEDFYIINLDREILTMNFMIHWKLGNIPRQDDLWLRSITESIYEYELTISLDICPEEHIASPDLEIPERNMKIHYACRLVNPWTTPVLAQEILLTEILAGMIIRYGGLITRLGLEWSPESFPFRELAFALISIASNQAKLHPMRGAQGDKPRDRFEWKRTLNHR